MAHSATPPGSGYGRQHPQNNPPSGIPCASCPDALSTVPSTRNISSLPSTMARFERSWVFLHALASWGRPFFPPRLGSGDCLFSAHSLIALPKLVDNSIGVLGGLSEPVCFCVLLVVSIPQPPPNVGSGHSCGHASDRTCRPFCTHRDYSDPRSILPFRRWGRGPSGVPLRLRKSSSCR